MDERTNGGKLPNVPTIDQDYFSATARPVTFHDYQVDAINLALAEQQGIIKCATGSSFFRRSNLIFFLGGGKTLMFAAIVKCLGPHQRCLIIIRSKTLVEQVYQFTKLGN